MGERRLSRGEAEITLAAAWKEVLGLQNVGPDDSFLDVGGNSLRAIQLLTLLRERLDATIELLDLFRSPTIRALLDTFYPQHVQTHIASTTSDAMVRAERCWRQLERMRQQGRQTHG